MYFSLRRWKEKGIVYYASLYSAHQSVNSSVYKSKEIIDKVGTGDCFMAGLIYGLHSKQAPSEIIQFATSAGFGKFFEKGDATGQTLETIRTRIKEYV